MSGLTEFPPVLGRSCGLDVHQKTVVATVQGTDIEVETRTFGTFTCEIKELGIWLNSLGVNHIAMERTGIYWKPVYNILEEDFEIILVNARHIKCPRPQDRQKRQCLDCQVAIERAFERQLHSRARVQRAPGAVPIQTQADRTKGVRT